MTASDIIFYLLAAITLGSAVLSVTTRHLFRAAVYLLFSLIGVAGIYFWLSYEFIAAVQIVVYVGGIVVLIIFSIFLTQQSGEKLPQALMERKLFSALAVFCVLALVMTQLLIHPFSGSGANTLEPSVANVGEALLDTEVSGMALPFEIISILLLAALVGCIVIAMHKGKNNDNTQNQPS